MVQFAPAGGSAPDVLPGLSPAQPVRVRWAALHYELTVDDAATRAYVWRQLHAGNGVSVQRGLWAVPDGPAGPVELRHVLARLRSVGATVAVDAVDPRTPVGEELARRLAAACERRWADLSTAIERTVDRLAGHAGGRGPDLAGLHDRFARTLAADLVQGPWVDRVARRLDDLEWIDRNLHGGGRAGPVAACRPGLEVLVTVALDDGRLRSVARLRPAPLPAWEHALAEFEASTYVADPRRPLLRHGTVVLDGTADEIAAARRAVEQRAARFNVS